MPHRRASLATWVVLLVQLLIPTLVQAQLISNSLPSCAQQCALLLAAQTSCETNPSTAQSCFCQDSQLQTIKTSGTNICAPGCSDSDFATIASWYKSTCASGGTNTVHTTLGTATTASTAAASSTLPPSTQGSDVNEDQTGTEWWATHYQWIVMLIVLIVAFTAIGVGGRYWYRRHHKKVDGEIVETTTRSQPPDMGMWAPSRQSVHDFTGESSQQRPDSTVAPLPGRSGTLHKGKQRLGAPPMPARTPSQRLKRAMESVQM